MATAQIVSNGVVINAVAVNPAAVLAPGGAKITWPGGELDAPAGTTLMMQPGAGIGWTLSSGVLVAPPAPAPTTAQLQAYANAKAASLLGAPRAYTSGAATIKVDATQGTRTDLGDLAEWGAANASATQPWTDAFDAVTQVTGAEFVAIAPMVGAYALSVYAALGGALQQIAAGSIATTAAIDALAWPS